MIFFSSSKKRKNDTEGYPIPDGEIYECHRDIFVDWINKVKEIPCKEIKIKSYDGLTLSGKYYECNPNAPIELMFHGYRGSSYRDLAGGVLRCFKLQRNVLLVDQRASGLSTGKVITFGIKERRDCLKWIDFIINEINKDAKIILTGISMGASTVLMASTMNLPKNVIGVIADCGFTSAKEIIKKVIKDLKLSANLLYPFAKLGALIFGHFNLEETSPLEAMKNSELPIIFFHGEDDQYVPHHMSVTNYQSCTSKLKRMVSIKNAGHGLCYLIDSNLYLEELRGFFDPIIK